MSDLSVRSIFESVGWLTPSQAAPEEVCKKKFNPTTEQLPYHLCVVDENIKIHESFRAKNLSESIAKTSAIVGLAGDDTKASSVSVAEHVNFESKNWVRLELAQKCLYLYALTEDVRHLDRASKLLEAGLAEKDLTVGFDLERFSSEAIRSETIKPVVGYFELKLAQLQVLNIIDPVQALEYNRKLETELADSRLVTAQRSNLISAQGYINKLTFLKADRALYQNSPDLDAAIKAANVSSQWADATLGRTAFYLSYYGLGQKDLIHDGLMSRVTAGELLVRKELAKPQADRKFDEAVQIFQAVLRTPVATQKFGGFLDMGLRAFANLLYIAMQQAETRQKAAEIFAEYVNWPAINNLKDFKETLGLLSRQEQSLFCELVSNANEKCVTWREGSAQWALKLGHPQWAFADNKPIVSEVNLNDPALSDPKTKLGITLRALQSSEIDKKMLGAIMAWWLAAS